MEGRREEYLANKGKVHAMFVEFLENAFLVSESDSVDTPHISSPPASPQISPTLDSDTTLPPVTHLCVTSSSLNSDLYGDLYSLCELEFPPQLALASIDSPSLALVTFAGIYNSLLDSGCTHHIIRDRTLFHSYTAKSISVGTANCGSLDAQGTGDVVFRHPFGTRFITFTLRDCLYAPTAPINLLSVGALVERGMSCLFSPGGITEVSFPPDHPKFPAFVLSATVSNRLSFLDLKFIAPPEVLPVALPAQASITPSRSPPPSYSFPRVQLDSMLWHRRFGHIGMDATRAALLKDYAKGITLEGSFIRDHCIPCLVGKGPHLPYAQNGNRATKVGELLHMDLCGPFPVQGPHGEKYFYNVLDDKSNWGFTFGLRLKSDAFSHYLKTEAFLERSAGFTVLTIRCGGELELTAGPMGAHIASKGIILQRTVPYAHQQNGKSEHYIRTIEEGGQALLADSGLPMSFWLDAMLTRQYLVNRLPTSTLPSNTTPFEVITAGRKPDLSHLRVWGCDCYVAIPNEVRTKAGPKRFQAIFVGYEEHRVGWRVRDLKGKYSFSNDVIFNESLSGRLGAPRSLSLPSTNTPSSSSLPVRPVRDHPRLRTSAGQAFDEVNRLRAFRALERTRKRAAAISVSNGGVTTSDSSAIALIAESGGDDYFPISPDLLDSFQSLLSCSSLLNLSDVESLSLLEPDILSQHFYFSPSSSFDPSFDSPVPLVLKATAHSFSVPRTFDLSKEPSSAYEALARPDAPVWRAAMERERQSLIEMGAFEEADLLLGEKAVGLKWVYDYKTDAAGVKIPGKEKARLVAQGFSQRPGQYDETYAPVAKMASVRILLAWAAVRDYEIFQFDCKTAFLHAKLRHPLYARPFPGFPTTDPTKHLRILVALYGLRQSAYEFYTLLASLLVAIGLTCCDVDHGIFYGAWSSPPDPSISMPVDGQPLVLYIPLHVDDGLGITNSPSLYNWFIMSLSRRLRIVDLGPCSKFLSIVIIRDRPNRQMWLSSNNYITELLSEWNLASSRHASTPFPANFATSFTAPPNSLPDISDADRSTKVPTPCRLPIIPRYFYSAGSLILCYVVGSI